MHGLLPPYYTCDAIHITRNGIANNEWLSGASWYSPSSWRYHGINAEWLTSGLVVSHTDWDVATICDAIFMSSRFNSLAWILYGTLILYEIFVVGGINSIYWNTYLDNIVWSFATIVYL